MDLKLSYIPAFCVISNVADKALGKKSQCGNFVRFCPYPGLLNNGVNFTKMSERRFEVHTHYRISVRKYNLRSHKFADDFIEIKRSRLCGLPCLSLKRF